MAFSFSSLNKARLFDFDTTALSGNYTNLEQLYKKNGEDMQYQIKGVYISTKSEFNDESPIVALADTYVNFPQHQLADIKSTLADKGAIKAINSGYAGFVIRKYQKNLKGKNGKLIPRDCYSAEWIDVDPADFDDFNDGEDLEIK